MKNGIVLVADDQEFVRRMIIDMLQDEYEMLEAKDGVQALEIMRKYKSRITAVILDLVMPNMDGFKVLEQCQDDVDLHHIPIVVATGDKSEHNETECLKKGAWEFIRKPIDRNVLKLRIRHVIERSELEILKRMKYLEEHDELTGIYNKQALFKQVRQVLNRNSSGKFAFIRMDIQKFQLINAFYGQREGDRLLKYIADMLTHMCEEKEITVYGRIRADVFGVCMPYKDKDGLVRWMDGVREKVNAYRLDHDIVPVFGIYVIEDMLEDVNAIDDRAHLALKRCKGNYIHNYAFYEASMSEALVREQKIVNSMRAALAEEQFVLYIQPKYDLHTNMIDGGEVLVRWLVPDKGMISPGEFIPVFERNGFIMKLDFYVWEHACQIIRRWIDEGRDPYPISVNMSRVSLYNPKLVDIICMLVKKYDIPPRLLQLELTESAYTSNPALIKEAMSQLQQKGFSILMDDFGSGYSSLNVLKDIAVDILKIDMRFLSDTDMPGRGENILASVVRMAKWLGMPVIAEGVEKESQAIFLRSIGCEFVQGYYFARPMPVEEYEKLAFSEFGCHRERKQEGRDSLNDFWNSSMQMEILFSNMLQPVAIYEFDAADSDLETIRVNNAYFDLFGYHVIDEVGKSIQNTVDPEYRARVLQTFRSVAENEDIAHCEFPHTRDNGKELWIELKLKFIRRVGDRAVVFGTLANITDQKEIERELRRYRQALAASASRVETILIVDDIEMNRQMLRNMFESEYNILEAKDGMEALDIARRNCHHIDVILLDVRMPVMDGEAFLEQKKEDVNIRDIPVVIITADDSPQQQVKALSMGANDYVVKPFIPEVVIRRVCNVLESQKKLGETLRDTDGQTQEEGHDYLTGLYNRNVAGEMIQDVLRSADGLQALLMIDIDNFRQVNERYGVLSGDRAIRDFAGRLQKCFRKSDILARYGGDEFIVFILDVPSREFLEKKCAALLKELRSSVGDGIGLECSVGAALVAAGDGANHFMELIGRADEALYEAKHKGKNQWYIYKEES